MTPSFVSPELQFVLAAARCDAGAAAARAQTAAGVTDWPAVAALAERHDVPWWVHRALPKNGVPDDTRRQLEETVRVLAISALAGTRELIALVRALEDAGVSVAAYKGPALAMDVHGDVGARRFTDLDLLIAERDREAARRTMAAIGYASPVGYSAREEQFYSAWEGVSHFERAGTGWPVEVHWRVQAPRYGPPQDPAAILAGARRCELGGGSVPLPDVETQAVLLALHGVKHAWTSLLWVVDFTGAASRAHFDWPRFGARAAQWGVERAVHDAVLLAHDLLALEAPADLLARARADAVAVRLADEARRGLVSDAPRPNADRESTARYDLQWLARPVARLRYLALAAALPTPREREAAQLPDALLPLAYPVRAWRLLRRAFGGRAGGGGRA